MTVTVFQIALLRLWNNKRELLLTLAVPITFFSIFALIFGSGVGSDRQAVRLVVVDDDQSPLSANITRLLQQQPAVDVDATILQTSEAWPIERTTKAVLKDSDADVVIHLPRGIQDSVQAGRNVTIGVLSDGSNPVGRELVSAMLSHTIAVALSKAGSSTGIVTWFRNRAKARRLQALYERQSQIDSATTGPSTSPSDDVAQRQATQPIGGKRTTSERPRIGANRPDPSKLVSVVEQDVFGAGKANPKIAMYAAGIAVMFLLFSATGAAGSLLEEQESGTLDRLLASQLSITALLGGKWLFMACLACVQLTVMFVWAQVAFDVDLLGHLPGFAVMTACTAAATASLALCLAVFCRSRAELNAVSIVIILTMSALGGSMVPRYLMSEEMRWWGQLTFNAWALDGFQKVFWQDLPVAALHAEVSVLLVIAVVLLCVARLWADRWAAA